MKKTVTVTAYGSSSNGIWPELAFLVDGKKVGSVKVTSSTPKTYSFEIDVASGKAHTFGLQYSNDANGRNLYVKQLQMDDMVVKPTDSSVRYDRGALDGKDVLAGTGNMYWNGTLNFRVAAEKFAAPIVTAPLPDPIPTPSTGDEDPMPVNSTITVTARGDVAGGKPQMTLLVNGKAIGTVQVEATAKGYTFDVPVAAADLDKVSVQYDNDANGRNLYVEKIDVNGQTISASDPSVTYDRGAADGKDMVKTTGAMYWNGTLTFTVDQADAPAPTPAPQPEPVPEPTPDNAEQPAPAPQPEPVPEPAPAPAPTPSKGDAVAPIPAQLADGPIASTGTVIRIAKGTGSEAVEKIINDAPKGATIQFDEGTYTFTSNIRITRGDITVKGAGMDKTTLDWRYPKGTGDDAITFDGGQKTKVTTLSAGTSESSKVITVADASKIQAGDTLHISQKNDSAYFKEIGFKSSAIESWMYGDKYHYRETIVEVDRVEGNKVYLKSPVGFEFASGKTNVAEMRMLENVNVGDFKVTYSSLGSADNVKWGQNTHTEFHMHSYALELNGLKNATVKNIFVKDAASGGYIFTDGLYVNAHNLTVDGAHNKNGGYGYAFNLDTTYNSRLTGLTDIDMRHGVTFHSWGTSGNNHIQIDYTNRDINFHGGPDWNNFIEVTKSDTYSNTTQYNQAVYFNTSGAKWGGPTDMSKNTVVFEEVIGGRKLKQWLTAAEEGGKLTGNSGADVLVGRSGDDKMTGQGGADIFSIRADGSHDVIFDFQKGTDKLSIANSGVSVSELLKNVRGVDLDGNGSAESTRIDLSDFGGGMVDLVGVTGGLSSSNFGSAPEWVKHLVTGIN